MLWTYTVAVLPAKQQKFREKDGEKERQRLREIKIKDKSWISSCLVDKYRAPSSARKFVFVMTACSLTAADLVNCMLTRHVSDDQGLSTPRLVQVAPGCCRWPAFVHEFSVGLLSGRSSSPDISAADLHLLSSLSTLRQMNVARRCWSMTESPTSWPSSTHAGWQCSAELQPRSREGASKCSSRRKQRRRLETERRITVASILENISVSCNFLSTLRNQCSCITELITLLR